MYVGAVEIIMTPRVTVATAIMTPADDYYHHKSIYAFGISFGLA